MLSLFRTLLLALAAATATLTTASPLPLPKESSSIAPHSQSCTARAPGGIGGELLKYDVRIGRVYDQNKCKAARKALRKSQELGAFSCKQMKGPEGHMRITFETGGFNREGVNRALDEVFPIIAGRTGGFRCPKH
ncbi:unnamed protein product [Zymoseptoria tritici ST99CH_3D7]|uniref:Uncharacterized protein n=1 Tax=Zymoseptoria tritici (strain ST99CH_3D7) TaxID=1276538 RepID=A0A1X7RKD8_ZYMT9|nr:unnamed protein product [Zymoseptoria tritici ST99CH_3D7]